MASHPSNALRASGQVCGDEDKVWVMAELGVFFGDVVDSDDDMAGLEGPQDDGLADEAVASSHCDLHWHVPGKDREDPVDCHVLDSALIIDGAAHFNSSNEAVASCHCDLHHVSGKHRDSSGSDGLSRP